MSLSSFSVRDSTVLLLASILGTAVGCSGDRSDSSLPERTVDGVHNSYTTNQLVALPEQAGYISVVEKPRSRKVFYEGAYRALVVEHGNDASFYPFSAISAGDRTYVEVYHIGANAYLLRDVRQRRTMDFLLDIRKGILYFRGREEGLSFVHPVVDSPATTLEHALQPNDLSSISVSVFYPVSGERPVFSIGNRPLQPLPKEYEGSGSLVGIIKGSREIRDGPKDNS